MVGVIRKRLHLPAFHHFHITSVHLHHVLLKQKMDGRIHHRLDPQGAIRTISCITFGVLLRILFGYESSLVAWEGSDVRIAH